METRKDKSNVKKKKVNEKKEKKIHFIKSRFS